MAQITLMGRGAKSPDAETARTGQSQASRPVIAKMWLLGPSSAARAKLSTYGCFAAATVRDYQDLDGGNSRIRMELVMLESNWTPSIIPSDNDQTVYLVAEDFG